MHWHRHLLVTLFESEYQEDNREKDMEDVVRTVHSKESENRWRHQSDDGHKSVHDSKDLAERLGHVGSPCRKYESEDTREEVYNVVDRINLKDAEEHSLWRERRNESKNTNDEEDDTEYLYLVSDHRLFGWVKRSVRPHPLYNKTTPSRKD